MAENVIFTSFKDDEYGGDTNNDSSDTSPSPGDWDKIYFGPTSINSELSNVIIRYAGGEAWSGRSGIRVDQSSIILRDSTIEHNLARHWAMDNQLMELIRFGCVRGEAEPYEWTKYTLSRAKIDKLLQVSPKVRDIKPAPLEINVSSDIAVEEAGSETVVISEQHTVGVETEVARQPDDIKDIRPTRKQKRKQVRERARKRL